MSHGLRFSCTNESLGSIVSGLNPGFGDRIFAVCGSGDQAFALTEYAPEVVAIDSDSVQLAYAQRRRDKLAKGDFKGFLRLELATSHNNPHFRNQYFQTGEKLQKIRENLDRLSFQKGEFLSVLKSELPSRAQRLEDKVSEERVSEERILDDVKIKLYLSNIFSYNGAGAVKLTPAYEKDFMDTIPKGTLVFFTVYKSTPLQLPFSFKMSELVQEEILSFRARVNAEEAIAAYWNYVVYQKQ